MICSTLFFSKLTGYFICFANIYKLNLYTALNLVIKGYKKHFQILHLLQNYEAFGATMRFVENSLKRMM